MANKTQMRLVILIALSTFCSTRLRYGFRRLLVRYVVQSTLI